MEGIGRSSQGKWQNCQKLFTENCAQVQHLFQWQICPTGEREGRKEEEWRRMASAKEKRRRNGMGRMDGQEMDKKGGQ
jgi:hypothetical protein